MNLTASKPVRFLLGPLQLLLFIMPFGAIFQAMPALTPLQGLLNFMGSALIGLSIVYLLFCDEIRISLAGAFPLFVVLCLLLISMSWVMPGLRDNSSHVTMRTIFTVLQTYVIVNVLGRDGLFRTLKSIAIGMALGNLAFMYLFPGAASWYFEDSSRIQGLFSSPNNMGQFLAFAFLVINFYDRKGLPLPLLLLIDAAIVFQLLRCDSMSSMGGIVVIFTAYRIRFLLKPLFFVVIALGLIVPHLDLILGNSDADLGINGRDMTFTGRTGVWEIIRSDLKLHNRTAIGFGSGGYWLAEEQYNPYSHINELEWYPGQGHNGYMDVMVNTGILGLVLVLFFLVRLIASIFKRVPYSEPIAYFLPLIVLINNITEASLFREKHFYFVLLMLVFWYLFLQPEEETELEADLSGSELRLAHSS